MFFDSYRKFDAKVLMFHRITEVEFDPWQLAVTPKNFDAQLSYLIENNYRMVTVADLLQQIERHCIQPKTVCITFDDGYVDNFVNAKPILEKYKIPATFFIPSHFIQDSSTFWLDELSDILFKPRLLPKNLSIKISETVFQYHFEDDNIQTRAEYLKQQKWVWPKKPLTRRIELYLKIYKILKPCPIDTISKAILELRKWANYSLTDAESHCMNMHQINSLIKNPLFSIQAHTHTHIHLPSFDESSQRAELQVSKSRLSGVFNVPIDVVAYPFGQYTTRTIELLQELNFKGAFTTSGGVVNDQTNIYEISRIQINNGNQKAFRKAIGDSPKLWGGN